MFLSSDDVKVTKRLSQISGKLKDIYDNKDGKNIFKEVLSSLKANLASMPNFLNSSSKLISALNLSAEYYTTINYIKLMEHFVQIGVTPAENDFVEKRTAYIQKLRYPIVNKKEHSFKKLSGNLLFFFYTVQSEYYIINSNCVEFRPENPILEFDEVVLPYVDTNSTFLGNLYYFFVPSGQTPQKYIQKLKKDTLANAEPEYTCWCKFNFSLSELLTEESQTAYVQAHSFNNKLDKFLSTWNYVALTIMIPCKNPDIEYFSSIAQVIRGDKSNFRRIHLRSTGLTSSNKDAVGNLAIETPIIPLNISTNFELLSENDKTTVKINTDTDTSTLVFPNKDEALFLANILKEFIDDIEKYGSKLVLAPNNGFNYSTLLHKCLENPSIFFENVNSHII